MQNAVFNISERTEKGKKVRMEGNIPAIMYGQSLGEPIPCQITKRELIDLYQEQIQMMMFMRCVEESFKNVKKMKM